MRQNKVSVSFLLAAVRGVCVGFAVIAVAFAPLAALVASEKLPTDMMQTAVVASAAAGALVGAIVGCRSFGAKKLLCGTAVGGGMLLICLVASALAEFNSFPNVRHAWMALAMVGGGVLGGLLSARRRGRAMLSSRKTKRH